MPSLNLITENPYTKRGEQLQVERLREQNLQDAQQQHTIREEQRPTRLRQLTAEADYDENRRKYELNDKSMEALKAGNVAMAQAYAQQAGTPIPDFVLNDAGMQKGITNLWDNAKRMYPTNPQAQRDYIKSATQSMLNTAGQFQYDPIKALDVPGMPPLPTTDSSTALPSGYQRTQDGKLQFIPGGPADPDIVSRLATERREVLIQNPLPNQGGSNVPSGYRQAPNGNLEFIPGGPADPGQKQRPERPLPHSAITNLSEIGGQSQSLERLGGGFQDRYGGNVILGETANTIGRYLGDSTGQTQWWQDYQNIKNDVRNRLFGSALTETERLEFDKAQIDPRMNAEQIRINLARQAALAQQAARKLARAYLASGYSREAIEGALGIPLEGLEQPQDVPGYAPQQQQPTAGAAPVSVNSPEEAMRLAPGTLFVTPDGRRKVR